MCVDEPPDSPNVMKNRINARTSGENVIITRFIFSNFRCMKIDAINTIFASVMQTSKQGGIELHGDRGSLFLSSWLAGDASVEFAPVGGQYEPVELARPAERGIVWSRGVP